MRGGISFDVEGIIAHRPLNPSTVASLALALAPSPFHGSGSRSLARSRARSNALPLPWAGPVVA